MEGFFLGVSSGTVCLAHCAPVLVPYLLGEGERTGQNALRLAEFLAGRLAGYILFGVAAWAVGRLVLDSPSKYAELFFGIVYAVLAVAMAFYGLFVSRDRCALKSVNGAVNRFLAGRRWALAGLLGFLTGINFCPPFLLAFSMSAQTRSLPGSILFFVAFFVGTSLYFVPTVLLGFASAHHKLKIIGKMTAVIMAFYFFYKGIVMIATWIVMA